MLEDEDQLQCSIQILVGIATVPVKPSKLSTSINILTLFYSSLYIYFHLLFYKYICLGQK